VDIRALERNASSVVARAAAGERLTITDRGRPVAQLTPIPRTPLQRLVSAGLARPARRSLAELAPPKPGPALSGALTAYRDAE
jgi:prevent-host-death family protein